MTGTIDLDLVFAALADPTRRAILTALLAGEASVTDLAAPFDMSLAGVSKHLRLLAQAGLVSQIRAGREKLCRLEPDGLNVAAIWMQGFGGFEGVDLDAVERVLAGLFEEEEPDAEAPVPGGAP
jgi:DNA-binding transcriptional ArsR family regulator